jgi:hypothetical protein
MTSSQPVARSGSDRFCCKLRSDILIFHEFLTTHLPYFLFFSISVFFFATSLFVSSLACMFLFCILSLHFPVAVSSLCAPFPPEFSLSYLPFYISFFFTVFTCLYYFKLSFYSLSYISLPFLVVILVSLPLPRCSTFFLLSPRHIL